MAVAEELEGLPIGCPFGMELKLDMNNNEERLRERVMAGACKRWHDTEMESFVAQRLAFELAMISQGCWTDYFLMVADMVEAARGAGGLVGPGRGRAVASAALYALGVTGVDPFRHENILFELFLPPDMAKGAALVCVDFDGIGSAAARTQLKSFDAEARPESGKGRFAPEWWRVGERCVGVTHLKALDRLALTIRLVAEAGGIPPDLDARPEEDAPVRRLLREGRRGRCGGPGACSAAYCLKAVRGCLRETHGVVAYDEQVVTLLRRLGGLTRREAYNCRKALARRMPGRVAEFKEKFLSGFVGNEELCKAEGLSADEAHGLAGEIWAELEHDAMFTSIKANDVAQARLACLSAYLKRNYPKEWRMAKKETNDE